MLVSFSMSGESSGATVNHWPSVMAKPCAGDNHTGSVTPRATSARWIHPRWNR